MDKKKSLTDALSRTEREEGVKSLLGKQEKALDELLEKTREKMDVENCLKKAKVAELEGDFGRALDEYLRFIEAKLEDIKTNPQFTIKDYFSLVAYYIKIAQCYEKTTHTTPGEKDKDKENAGDYYLRAGRMYEEMGEHGKALEYYEKAAVAYEESEALDKGAKAHTESAFMHYRTGQKMLAVSALIKAAQFYEKGGDYENASNSYLKTAKMNLELKDIYGAINSYKLTAQAFDRLGDQKKAIDYYVKSAELSSTVERYNEVAEKYTHIAQSYEKINECENAIYYYLRAADINTGNDNLAASYCYDNAARCYVKNSDLDSAIENYKKSTKLRTDLKKYVEAAASSYEIAKYYEQKQEAEEAAKYYSQYSDLQMGPTGKAPPEGYKKAVELYLGIAKKKLDAGEYEKAMAVYLEATKCYDKLDDAKSSGDLYSKMAAIMVERDYDTAVNYYTSAAKRYVEVMEYADAGRSYMQAKDYINAAKNYILYAEAQSKMNEAFYAAEGYRRAGTAYRKFRKESDMRQAYSKAIHNYRLFLEKAIYFRKEDPEANLGTANRRIGECYMESDDIPHAKEYLLKALAHFKEKNNAKEMEMTETLLKIVDSNLSMKRVDYEKGKTLMEEAHGFLEKTIKEGEWSEEYLEFLAYNKERVEELMKKMDLKPEIELSVEQPKGPVPKGRLVLSARITNNGPNVVSNIYFLPSFPADLRPLNNPENLKELGPKESRELTLEADASKTGKFSFTPLEILYKDKGGNKYMKSSNQIIVEITRKQEDGGK